MNKQHHADVHDDDATQVNMRLPINEAEAQVLLTAIEHCDIHPRDHAILCDVAARLAEPLGDLFFVTEKEAETILIALERAKTLPQGAASIAYAVYVRVREALRASRNAKRSFQ